MPVSSSTAIVCSSCGARLKPRARPPHTGELVSSNPIESIPLLDPEPSPATAPLEDAGSRPRRGRKKKGRAESARGKGRVLAASIVAGGIAVVLALAACVTWIWPRGGDQEAVVAKARDEQPDSDDRDRLAQPPLAEFTPIPWSVPASVPAAAPVLPSVMAPDWASQIMLLKGQDGAYLAVRGPTKAEVASGSKGERALFGRLDLKSGRPRGDAQVLGQGFAIDRGVLAPDRTLAIPNAAGQIHFWAPGAKESRTIAGLTAKGASWFDWSSDNRLLVVDNGKLVAWDVAAARSIFEAGTALKPPVALAPDRNWLAVTVGGKYLEVLDSRSGQCRGRFGGEGRWQQLAIAPDGKRLAGLRFAGAGDSPANSSDHWYAIHDWDLATGQRKGMIGFWWPSGGPLQWASPNHVLLGGLDDVFDLDHHVHIARLDLPPGPVKPHLFSPSPDGRVWWITNPGRDPARGPGLSVFTVALPLKPAYGQLAFHPGVPVEVEARCGDAGLDRRVIAAFTDILKETGYSVTASPWKLRVTGETFESDQQMHMGKLGPTIKVPGVRGEICLIAPNGATVHTVKLSAKFPGIHSAYFKKRKSGDIDSGGPFITIEEYDFKGTPPAQAMSAETWDHFIAGLDRVEWPRGAWQSDNEFLPLPRPLTLTPPAGLGKGP